MSSADRASLTLTRASRRGQHGCAPITRENPSGPRRGAAGRGGSAGRTGLARGRVAAGRRRTRVEEDDGAQAAELRLVHLHVPHLGHQLRQHPAGKRGQASGQTAPSPRNPGGPGSPVWARRAAETVTANPGAAACPVPPRRWAPLLSLKRVCAWDLFLGTWGLKWDLVTAGVSQSPGRRGQGPPAQGPAGPGVHRPRGPPGCRRARSLRPSPGTTALESMSPAPSPLQGGSVPLLSSATDQTPTTVTSPAAGNHGSASWCEAGAAFLNILGTCPLGWLLWGTNAAPRCPLGWHFCTRAVKGPATACSRDTPGSVYTSACPRCMAQAGRSGAALCPTCSIPRGSPVPAGIPGVTGGGGLAPLPLQSSCSQGSPGTPPASSSLACSFPRATPGLRPLSSASRSGWLS